MTTPSDLQAEVDALRRTWLGHPDTAHLSLTEAADLVFGGLQAAGTLQKIVFRLVKHEPGNLGRHRALSREEERKVDATLGLHELPPIRVDAALMAALEDEGRRRGVVLQAAVRQMLAASAGRPIEGLPVQDDEAEFEVLQTIGDDVVNVAGTSGPRERALAEAMNYAQQYALDGAVEVYEIRRTRVV
jgi:hypothetical protein